MELQRGRKCGARFQASVPTSQCSSGITCGYSSGSISPMLPIAMSRGTKQRRQPLRYRATNTAPFRVRRCMQCVMWYCDNGGADYAVMRGAPTGRLVEPVAFDTAGVRIRPLAGIDGLCEFAEPYMACLDKLSASLLSERMEALARRKGQSRRALRSPPTASFKSSWCRRSGRNRPAAASKEIEDDAEESADRCTHRLHRRIEDLRMTGRRQKLQRLDQEGGQHA